jgi:hypothetical protein
MILIQKIFLNIKILLQILMKNLSKIKKNSFFKINKFTINLIKKILILIILMKLFNKKVIKIFI